MDEPLLTIKEVCIILKMAPRTIANLIRTGRLRNFRMNREHRFKSEWIEEFIEKSPRGIGKRGKNTGKEPQP